MLIPALLGTILWQSFIVRPQDEQAITQRQKQLVRDDIILLHNQLMICAALRIDCIKETDLNEEHAP